MEKTINYYETDSGYCPYLEWLETLDKSIKVRVIKRVDKLKNGLLGDHKPLQNSELSELRLDFGAGYRIYYYDKTEYLIILFAGSDKKDQKKIIEQANIYFENYKQQQGA